MRTQETTRPFGIGLAAPVEDAAVMELTVRQESAVSDAPQYTPEAAQAFAMLLSPKEPKERKDK
ncbi:MULTISPECIES: hypothetical protein [unclassified Streptomyces]|uniref:hypothetical protein n=1 Tax=unclassified Streptomyces TaxID=2593676 RepID=UPI003FD4360E